MREAEVGGLAAVQPTTIISTASATMATFVKSSGRVSRKDVPNLIAHASEDGVLLVLGAGRVRGVVEAPMVAIHLAGEHRARLVGVAADGDDGLHFFLKEFAEVL